MITPKNRLECLLVITEPGQLARDLWNLLRRYEGLRAIAVFRRREHPWVLANEVLQLHLIEYIVEADTDVARAHELRDVVDVTNDGFGTGIVVSQKEADAVDSHDASGCRAGLDRLVAYVATMRPHRGRIRVREDDRPVGQLHHLHGRAVSGMAAAGHHADAMHLGEHRAAEGREAAVVVLAASAEKIVLVVCEQHPAHAQVVI